MLNGLRSDLREVHRAVVWGYNRSSDPSQPTLAELTGKAALIGGLAAGTALASKKLFENPDKKIVVLPAIALAASTFSETGKLIDEMHDFANLMRFSRIEL